MGKKLEKVKRFEFTFITQINRLSMIYMDVRLSQVLAKDLIYYVTTEGLSRVMAFPVIVKILAILWLTVDLFSFVFTESFPFHTFYDLRLKFVNFQAQQLNHFCCVLPLKVHPIETPIPYTE